MTKEKQDEMKVSNSQHNDEFLKHAYIIGSALAVLFAALYFYLFVPFKMRRGKASGFYKKYIFNA